MSDSSFPQQQQPPNPDGRGGDRHHRVGKRQGESISTAPPPGNPHEAALMAIISPWQHRLAQELEPILSHATPSPQHSTPFDPIHLNRMINLIMIRLLWLSLCEHQGMIPKGSLIHCSHHPHAHQRCWQWFQQLNSASHDLPQAGNTHPWIRDAVFQPMLSQFIHISEHLSGYCHHQNAPVPEAILGKVYEYLLAKPLAKSDHQPGPSPLSSAEAKKALGIYYTPAMVVENMVEQTVGRYCRHVSPCATNPITILDPACGSGAFLTVAYRRLLGWYRDADYPETALEILQRHIYGVDLDPQAVELTRLSLLLILGSTDPASLQSHQVDLSANIQWGNALIDIDVDRFEGGLSDEMGATPLGAELRHRLRPFNWSLAFPQIMAQGGFDIVLGNPPYVDAEWMSRHQPIERRYCASHYQTASGNWDLFCVFCEQALRLCKPNGLHSFIVPNKLAAADYAQATRRLLTVDNQLLYLRDYSQIPVFSIAVYPLVYVVQKAVPTNDTVEWERLSVHGVEHRTLAYATHFSQSQRQWAIAPSPSQQSLINQIRHQGQPLGDLATVHGAATVAEAYAIKPLLRDVREPASPSPRLASAQFLKFVNSGTIDPYQFLWGRKTVRYLKDDYQAPIIPAELAPQLPSKRLQQAQQAKIIMAGMTRGLECAVDFKGEFLAGKSTTIITSTIDLRYLAAILNSQLINLYYTTEFGGNALNGGYLRIGPPQLKTLPIVVGSDRQQTTLIALVDRLIHAHYSPPSKSENRHEQATILHEIDQRVCALYGVSEEAVIP
ncbi:MAG: N-6 DNA methylase [Leptolyngbyaceae bacterium]|nr:N-6 DNA methylase [Leptolyngbyaceae bacterium]